MQKIAVIIPCLNEEAAIGRVVADCKAHLPFADIYVLDNGSEDQTSSVAKHAGALVLYSPLRGKGNVVQHAFRVIEADFFLLIDGDGTYPLSEAQHLLKVAREHNYDMVMGSRLEQGNSQSFRPLHYLGNQIFTVLVRILFNFPMRDLLTGYRVFSRRFAKEMIFLSRGFEIETELTIRAIAQGLPFCEVAIPYGQRAIGGKSKLRTFRDGWKILLTIFKFFMYFRPFFFFTGLAVALSLFAGSVEGEFRTFLSVAAVMFFGIGFHLDWRMSMYRMRPNGNGHKASTEVDRRYTSDHVA